MMFTMIFSVTVLIFCVLVRGGRSEELSKIALDLLNVRSGYYDNQEQIDKGYTDYDFIQIWFIPVSVSFFGSKPVFLFVEARDGSVIRVQLHVVTSTEVDLVETTFYNYTDPSLYKIGEFPLKNLENLTLDQINSNPACISNYKLVGPGVFTTDYPICSRTVKGRHPLYGVTLNCDEVLATAPIGSLEREGIDMYDFKRKGDKYKLPNAPDNYVGPCDK